MTDLSNRNYVLVVDKSGSMAEPVGRSKPMSRWDAMREYVSVVTRKCCELDADGIDVYLFGTKFSKFENVTVEVADQIFKKNSPMGGTDFVPVLTDVFNKHFSGDKPTTVLVVTDGQPSDGVDGQKALAKLLVATANKIEADNELAVQFLQIGDDPDAAKFLKKLDDDLQGAGAKFDIVDTKTCDDLESMSLEEVLLAAISD
jgi:hypothetical protein